MVKKEKNPSVPEEENLSRQEAKELLQQSLADKIRLESVAERIEKLEETVKVKTSQKK